jgi:uncharacterized protein with HEPN domain
MKNIYNYKAFLNEKNYQNSELIVEGIKIPDPIKNIAKKIVDKYPKKAKAIAEKYKGLSLEQIIAKLKPSLDPIENKIEQEVQTTNEGLKDIWSAIKNKIGDYQDKIDSVLTTIGLVGLGAGLITTVIDATKAIPGIGHYGDSMFSIAVGLIIFGIVTLVTNAAAKQVAQ